MNEKILIIDDEESIVKFIKDSLVCDGYSVFTAYNGNDAMKMIWENPDLILLDIMMPDVDGFSICQSIREKVACPIIFLSARQLEEDRIKGFAIGGDDYITKPFSLKELKARIGAHLRREKRSVTLSNRAVLRFGDITVDLKGREVCFKDSPILFARREFDIIEFLCLHPGRVFSKEQIYESIWGYDAEGDSSSVAEHIKRIRSKLAEVDNHTEYIITVWSVGYKWARIK